MNSKGQASPVLVGVIAGLVIAVIVLSFVFLLPKEPSQQDGQKTPVELCKAQGCTGTLQTGGKNYRCGIDREGACHAQEIRNGKNNPPECGNGVVEQGEQCDDRNTVSGDGCSSTCAIEDYVQGFCGDNVIQEGEECEIDIDCGETQQCSFCNCIELDGEGNGGYNQSDEEVRLVSSTPCTDGTCDTVHLIGVNCNNLPERLANVWVTNPAGSSKGSILLTIGGMGNGRYATAPEKKETVRVLVDEGFQTFEIDWSPTENGWFVEGAGYGDSACAYAAAVRWLYENEFDNQNVVCAQGNSGGSFQIAYGLASFELENILDFAILSAGPPVPEVDRFCFDESYQLGGGGAPGGGAEATDFVMGWEGNGDYCKTGSAPQSIVDETDKTSVVSDLAVRDYDYPNTLVHFFGSETDNSFLRAKEYFNVITSAKEISSIPGSVHSVDQTEEGAQVIRELFINNCK